MRRLPIAAGILLLCGCSGQGHDSAHRRDASKDTAELLLRVQHEAKEHDASLLIARRNRLIAEGRMAIALAPVLSLYGVAFDERCGVLVCFVDLVTIHQFPPEDTLYRE